MDNQKESLDENLFNSRFNVVDLSESNQSQSLDLSSTGSTCMDTWFDPIRIQVIEHYDSIEFVYKETSMITLTIHPSPPPEVRVFKIVFSCKKGKWHKSERIYGEIVESTDEYYEFDE